jgi:hypothetical protein
VVVLSCTDSDLLTPPCNEWRGYRAEPVDLDVAGC